MEMGRSIISTSLFLILFDCHFSKREYIPPPILSLQNHRLYLVHSTYVMVELVPRNFKPILLDIIIYSLTYTGHTQYSFYSIILLQKVNDVDKDVFEYDILVLHLED